MPRGPIGGLVAPFRSALAEGQGVSRARAELKRPTAAFALRTAPRPRGLTCCATSNSATTCWVTSKMHPRSQTERAASSRRALIKATLELVAERGLDGFSLADVGARAGVSRGLAGHHFHSRENLMRAAFGDLLEPRPVAGELGLNRLLASLKRSVQRVREPHVRALLLVLTAPGPPAFVRDAAADYWASVSALVEAHLKAGVAAGLVREEVEPPALAQQILASLFGLALAAQWRPLDAQDAAGFLASTRRLIVRPEIDQAGVSPRPGPRRPRGATNDQSLFPELE